MADAHAPAIHEIRCRTREANSPGAHADDADRERLHLRAVVDQATQVEAHRLARRDVGGTGRPCTFAGDHIAAGVFGDDLELRRGGSRATVHQFAAERDVPVHGTSRDLGLEILDRKIRRGTGGVGTERQDKQQRRRNQGLHGILVCNHVANVATSVRLSAVPGAALESA